MGGFSFEHRAPHALTQECHGLASVKVFPMHLDIRFSPVAIQEREHASPKRIWLGDYGVGVGGLAPKLCFSPRRPVVLKVSVSIVKSVGLSAA